MMKASWLVVWGQPVSQFLVWHMKRYMPQFCQPVSGSSLITTSHVPTYLPPSPSWIRGIGNSYRLTSSPSMMFSLHGASHFFTNLGGIFSTTRVSYSLYIWRTEALLGIPIETPPGSMYPWCR